MKIYMIKYTPVKYGKPEGKEKIYKILTDKEEAKKTIQEEYAKDRGYTKNLWRIKEIEIDEE